MGKITQMMKLMNGGKINPFELLKMTGMNTNPQMAELLKLMPLLANNSSFSGLGNLFGNNNNNNSQPINKGNPVKELPPKDVFAYDLYQLSKS